MHRARRAAAMLVLGAWVLLAGENPGIAARPAAAPPTAMKIVTASPRGTYIRIGRDLATFVAPSAGIALDVLPSAGSAENVRRLRYEPGVALAIVQSDVYQAFLDEAASGNVEAATMIRPLRVVLPLYEEEIAFVVRADSPLHYVHELRGARINIGEVGSGTALTTATLYRLMFGVPIPTGNATFLAYEPALAKLVDERSIDVVAIIAGQPAKILADMKPEARRFVRLLSFDRANPASAAALGTYFATTLRASSYPNLLDADLPALAVKSFLVTYDFGHDTTRRALTRFAQSLCRNMPALRELGHPKWREVSLDLPALGRGWAYYAPTARALRQCRSGSFDTTGPAAAPAR